MILNDGVTITGEALTLTGSGGSGSFGALRAAGNATATWAGSITTTGSEARIGSLTGGNLIITGNIDASSRDVIIRSEGGSATTGPDFDNTVVTLGGTYTGSQLIIFQGVVKLGASERLQDSTVLNLGTTASATIKQRFDLNGYSETVAALITSGSGTSDTHEVTNTSSTLSTLTLNAAGANREFFGTINGNLAIQKNGTNTVIFSGVNSYTGNTAVNAGVFNVTTSGALNGGGSTTVANGATFNLLGTYLFGVRDNGNSNSIGGGGILNLGGIVNFDLSLAALADGNSWNIVNVLGLSAVNWTGMRVISTAGDFTETDNVWTLANGDSNWTFSESTGVLTLAYIPEPSQTLLLLAGFAGFSLRRRRTA